MSCYKLNSIPAISQHSLKFQNTEKPQSKTYHHSTVFSYNPPYPGNALHFFTAVRKSLDRCFPNPRHVSRMTDSSPRPPATCVQGDKLLSG